MTIHRVLSRVVFLALVASGRSQSAPAPYPVDPASIAQPGVPRGEIFAFEFAQSRIYPGAHRTCTVYVPAQYDPAHPACLFVGMDGVLWNAPTVFDNLISRREMPVTIGVFVSAGTVDTAAGTAPARFDRSYEFDSVNPNFVRFLLTELLPAVAAHRPPSQRLIRLSDHPDDRAIGGSSSGAICAFTAAWQRPDAFRRVFSCIGTFVGMRGGDGYPTWLRKTEPKPLRVFLQDGAKDTWNPLFGNWWTNNQSMEASLRFAGYAVDHEWGQDGHDGRQGTAIFPKAMRWLWKDWPAPVQAGVSGNSMLQAILQPGAGWQAVDAGYPVHSGPLILAANPRGEVYAGDRTSKEVRRVDRGDRPGDRFSVGHAPAALAFGPDGRCYAVGVDGRAITAGAPGLRPATVARHVGANHLLVGPDRVVYATESGATDALPSRIWRIGAGGQPTILDTGIRSASGLAFSPDGNLLFVAEAHSHWIVSFVRRPDGTLADRQRFYWLHGAEDPDDAGDTSDASDLAVDRLGNLYVATRLGIQVCDRNGRVEAILTLPEAPGQAVASLCFGDPDFQTLYAAAGQRIFRRRLKISGVPGWSAPVTVPPGNAG
jgi:enterochelin esterase-like enzyme